jgi:hypothetical protein
VLIDNTGKFEELIVTSTLAADDAGSGGSASPNPPGLSLPALLTIDAAFRIHHESGYTVGTTGETFLQEKSEVIELARAGKAPPAKRERSNPIPAGESATISLGVMSVETLRLVWPAISENIRESFNIRARELERVKQLAEKQARTGKPITLKIEKGRVTLAPAPAK